MTALGKNAQLLSNSVLAPWLIEDEPRRIQLASVFPFFPIAGDSLRYATTPALQPAVTVGFGDGIVADTKLPNDPNRVFDLVDIATRFQVTYRAQDVFSSNVNDQTSVQMALAIRELLYKFWTLFESGSSSNPDEFDGLINLVDPAQIVDLDHQPLTLEALAEAKERVRSNDGRGVVMFTDGVGKRAINAAHWSRGLRPEYAQMSFECSCRADGSEKVLVFDGAPVYLNDLNQQTRRDDGPVATAPKGSVDPAGSPTATNIWFFVMGEANLHGITPAALESSLFLTRSTLQPDGSTMDYHVTMPVGLALGSASSLAVVKNVTIPAGGARPSRQEHGHG